MSLLQTALNGRPGAEKKEGGWEVEEVNVQVMSLQTALNGRPGAMESQRGCGGVNLVRGRFTAPDGPKWTARSNTVSKGVED